MTSVTVRTRVNSGSRSENETSGREYAVLSRDTRSKKCTIDLYNIQPAIQEDCGAVPANEIDGL